MKSKRISRRQFLVSTGIATGATCAWSRLGFAATQAGGRKPNILLILADDLGYGELSCQGPTDVPSPNIDSIAASGVRFTNGYVTCPVCSPTRAGLLTGRYQQRFGHEFNPGSAGAVDVKFGLPLSEKTIAEYLKEEGYATGLVGKWHLGDRPECRPQQRGFDEFFGFLGGAHSYVDSQRDPKNMILRGAEKVNEPEYLTDAFTREALAFIARHKSHPFFLYLAYNAVHGPMEKSVKREERFAAIADEKRRTFATMLTALDEGVGAVLNKLRETGLEQDTLVIFLSDNGGPTQVNTARNTPLSSVKGQVLEGGIRIPYMMQWKGRIPAGNRFEQPINSLDILPTALTAAGGKILRDMKLEGTDLIPFVTGKKTKPPHEALFWRFGEQYAARMGDWKLVKQDETAPRIYNLAADISEQNDLAGKEPKKLKQLQSAYDRWNAQNVEPLWKPRRLAGTAAGQPRPRRQRERPRRARNLR
ncbi:MAG: sulfatase-like hydrolase/transferase [Candidatus Hydrogenedentes bacterium]|nr:sulfatase-like hydrolase/transferase [Candidatus Hydrogenedentota bacterium]